MMVRLLHNGELLNGELFYSLKEARIIIESWRRHYNGIYAIGNTVVFNTSFL